MLQNIFQDLMSDFREISVNYHGQFELSVTRSFLGKIIYSVFINSNEDMELPVTVFEKYTN